MNIFHKRPLALVLSIAILALFAYSSGEVWHRVATLAAIPLLFILSFIIRSKKSVLLVCTIALAISSLCSYLYFDLWFYPHLRFEGDVQIVAEIETINHGQYYNSIYIKTDSINGTPFSSHRLVMYMNDEDTDKLSVGNTVEFIGTLSTTKKFGSEVSSYYGSSGVASIVDPKGEITVTDEGSLPLSYYCAAIREHLRRRAIFLSNEETGNLLAALLLGERIMLSSDVALGFTRVGITHMLALSGMHLAILTLGVGKALSLLGISKKPRCIILILFTVLYMALTGFPISVVRAGIMLIITHLLFLCGLSHDSVTSLSIAVFLICLIIPYSVFDISLWLSALATLGVVLLSEFSPRKKYKNKLLEFLHFILMAFLSSVFAITATFAICLFSFEGISLLSPISTMLLSPLIEAIMYTGSIVLLIGDIIPLGGITILLAKAALGIINFGSSLDYAYVIADHTALKIAVIVATVLFYAFAVLKVKHKKVAVGIICVAFATVFTLAFAIHHTYISDDEVIYLSTEDDNTFIIKDAHEVTVIDSAAYYRDRGYTLTSLLFDNGITVVDTLQLTGYGFGISSELDTLSRYVLVRRLSLPKPQNEDEETILAILSSQADKIGCEIALYGSGEVNSFGNVEIRHLTSKQYGTNAGVAFELKADGNKYVYMSSGFDYEGSDILIKEYLETVDGIIFGSYGSAYKKKTYFDHDLPKLQLLIFDAENLFLTQEKIEYYEGCGCKIYSHPQRLILAD